MTAHVVFEAIDRGRCRPASRPRVTAEVIRGAIGFDGLLMSDDLGMKALSGSIAERAAAVIAAGSDVALLCSGDLAETEAVAAVVPALEGARTLQRFERACAVFGQQQPFDVAEAEAGAGAGVARRCLNWCSVPPIHRLSTAQADADSIHGHIESAARAGPSRVGRTPTTRLAPARR